MTLRTTDLPFTRALNLQEQAGLLDNLNSSPLFATSSDPRLAKPRAQFSFVPVTETGHSVLSVTSHSAEHPNVVRLVKVILKMP
jgi:hypothetical protein